ncbi:MAG TPA: TonB-dependent receptor plug domain-containing protein, partial [Chryseosolibacter sp.]
NLQVLQLNASAWIVSARGFNAVFSNKLLVMIDGRTVYSPLFAGVFWDVQNVLLEDVDRIEVISGPGGSIWGANAVNGVINIITKNSADTQGFYASAGAGTFLRRNASLRYGGKIGSEFSYRIYGVHANRDHTFLANGDDNSDAWNMTQSGFSLDWTPSLTDAVAVHGNLYSGIHENVPGESSVDGQNILGRWSRTFKDGSALMVQGYYDRTWRRDIPSTISDQTETYDFEFDHSINLGSRHRIVWGGGYRLMDSRTYNATPILGLVPAKRNMNLYSGFIQDEISLAQDHLRLTIGTKVQHTIFSGFEIQPTARLGWTGSDYTLWGAVSRAVRAPSRIDVDYFIPTFPIPPDQPSVAGGPNFVSEKVIAWEAGYRYQPVEHASLSLATFYNVYNDLYSVDSLPNTKTYQIQNGTEGTSRGLELTGRFHVTQKWHLRGGYTYFHKDLANKPGHIYDFSALGNDAEHRFTFHSMLDLPANLKLDVTFRYIDALPKPYISDYLTFDARMAWVSDNWEISVTGQNLWKDRHQEILAFIPATLYGNISCRF